MPLDGRALAHNVLEDMRFRAIQSYEQGRGVLEIADLLDLHWGSVSRWLTKWRRGGLKALQARRATGRPKKLDCQEHGRAILKVVSRAATQYGYEHPLWTCKRIAQVIRDELKLVVSIPTLWRGLQKIKLSKPKPGRSAVEQEAQERAARLQMAVAQNPRFGQPARAPGVFP